jgi:hypothetical protein
MKMSGTREIEAPQAEVWAKLNDIDVLKRCIPGCESLERKGENELKATVAVKIGPMSARFNGDVTLSELNPPHSYRISGKGQGGAAGFASGGANVKLAPNGAGTTLSYDVDATVGGKLAQLGARLIDATAAQLSKQFFDRFAAEFQPAEPAIAAAGGAARSAPAAKSSPARSAADARWVWWALGAVVAIAAIYLFRSL